MVTQPPVTNPPETTTPEPTPVPTPTPETTVPTTQEPATTPIPEPTKSPDDGNSSARGQQPSGDATFNKDKFGDTLTKNAGSTSKGICATRVRQALEAGGVDTSGHPRDAKDWGPTLEKGGFKPVEKEGYVPQKGDVVVIQPYPGGSPEGHIAAHDGSQWASDFKQKDMWGGQGYRQNQPPYVIYRRSN